MAIETIDHNTLVRLVEAGVACAVHVISQAGGWGIVVQYGTTEKPLAASRSRQLRVFKKLETVVSYLKQIGIVRFDVDAVNHDAAQLKTHSRPDRAQAMRQAHLAMAHDQWFRAQVQQGLEDTRAAAPHGMVVADLRATLKGMADKHDANRAD